MLLLSISPLNIDVEHAYVSFISLRLQHEHNVVYGFSQFSSLPNVRSDGLCTRQPEKGPFGSRKKDHLRPILPLLKERSCRKDAQDGTRSRHTFNGGGPRQPGGSMGAALANLLSISILTTFFTFKSTLTGYLFT